MMNFWIFIINVGLLIIVISPILDNHINYTILGLIIAIFGFMLCKINNKK